MSSIVSDAFRLEMREEVGGGAARATRRKGLVPAELYGAGGKNVHLALDPRDVMKGLNTSGFYSTVFELNVNGKKERALVREVQMHPVKDTPIHVDFMRVSKGAKIHVNIPLKFINEKDSPGLKRGGVLNMVLHSIDVTCGVDNIPDAITIDLSGLEIGETVHTENLDLGKNVTLTHPDKDNTVATIVAPSSLEAESEPEETKE